MENNHKQQLVNAKHKRQLNNEDNNPCIKEQKMSYDCLDTNHYDPEMCQKHFENYKTCKSFWSAVMSHRRRNGIRPLLPPLEERAHIKEKYILTGKL